jgi:hypothetical protein
VHESQVPNFEAHNLARYMLAFVVGRHGLLIPTLIIHVNIMLDQ